MFTKKTGRHYCTTFGVFKAASSPGISKCVECGKEHAPEEIQEAIYRAIREYSPDQPRDRYGRFASVAGSGGGGSRDSSGEYDNQRLAKAVDADSQRIEKKLKQEYLKSSTLYEKGTSFENVRVSERDAMRYMTDEEAAAFRQAVESTDYEKSDTLFLKAIQKDGRLTTQFRQQTEEIIAYNDALATKAANTEHVHTGLSHKTNLRIM